MKIGKQITEVMIINGNHFKHKYNDIVLDSQIKYKNDLRLLELAKEERNFTSRRKILLRMKNP
jgi:hypothetical protein